MAINKVKKQGAVKKSKAKVTARTSNIKKKAKAPSRARSSAKSLFEAQLIEALKALTIAVSDLTALIRKEREGVENSNETKPDNEANT